MQLFAIVRQLKLVTTNLGKALRWEYADGGNGVGIKGLKRFVRIFLERLETSLPSAMVEQAICLIFQLYTGGEIVVGLR